MRGLRQSAWLLGVGLLTAACGSAQPAQTFHPGGASLAASASAAAPAPSGAADGLSWPPFGNQVRIVMPGWKPSQASEAPAVTADKNFLLALLYAEYRGNQDSRWQAYAGPRLRPVLAAQLAKPDITTQSFTGTIRFSHLSAFPDPMVKGAIDVAQCFDNSHSANTSLSTGRPIPDRTPADQHYYRTTNALARASNGTWQVISMYPAVYYPRAPECKP